MRDLRDLFYDLFVGFLIVWIVICVFFIPPFMFKSWLAARDCRLLNQTECVWQMVPVMEKKHE